MLCLRSPTTWPAWVCVASALASAASAQVQLLDTSSATVSMPGSDSDAVPAGLVLIIVAFVLIMAVSIGCGLFRLCRKGAEGGDHHGPSYSVAISNRLFKDDGLKELPCLNCRLIEMGEMVCYEGKCPQCGRPPPGAKKPLPPAPGPGQAHLAGAGMMPGHGHDAAGRMMRSPFVDSVV